MTGTGIDAVAETGAGTGTGAGIGTGIRTETGIQTGTEREALAPAQRQDVQRQMQT